MGIETLEDLNEWLADQTHEVCCLIASRSAARVLATICSDPPGVRNQLLLPVLRAILTSASLGVAQASKPSELVDSASAAAGAVSSNDTFVASSTAAVSASAAAVSASLPTVSASAISAIAATSTAGAAYSLALPAAFQDAPQPSFGTPLWPVEARSWVEEDHLILLVLFDANAERWSWWKDWYLGIWNGDHIDWDFATQVALIDEEIWKEGADAVADEIRRLQAKSLAGLLNERINLNPEGRVTRVGVPMPDDPLLSQLLATVRDSVELATADFRNGLAADCYQVRLLNLTFTRYGNDLHRIELDFERAKASLISDIADDIIPSTGANRDLIQTLGDAAEVIRQQDDDIRANRDRLKRIRLGQLDPEVNEAAADATLKLIELADEDFAEELLEDYRRLPGVQRGIDDVPDPVVPLGAAERNAALEIQASRLRVYSRLAKTWLYFKEFDRAELARLMAMPEVQLVGFFAALASLIGYLAPLL